MQVAFEFAIAFGQKKNIPFQGMEHLRGGSK